MSRAVGVASCYYRGPSFPAQCRYGVSQPFITPVRGSDALLWPLNEPETHVVPIHICTHIFIHTSYMYICDTYVTGGGLWCFRSLYHSQLAFFFSVL